VIDDSHNFALWGTNTAAPYHFKVSQIYNLDEKIEIRFFDRIPSESLDMGPVVGVRTCGRVRETEFTDGSGSTY
jgi:hypothetical protein